MPSIGCPSAKCRQIEIKKYLLSIKLNSVAAVCILHNSQFTNMMDIPDRNSVEVNNIGRAYFNNYYITLTLEHLSRFCKVLHETRNTADGG